MSESRFRALPWILVGALGFAWIIKGTDQRSTEKVNQTTPMLVESIRQLGFLQTVEMNLSEAFQYQTHRLASESLSSVPLVTDAVKSATKNEVWVQANGSVTAGIDLSKAKIEVRNDTIRVSLPSAVIQDPKVDLKLISSRRGWFWRDDSILLKATTAAKQRFVTGVQKRKIEEQAMTQAKAQVRNVVSKVSSLPVVFERA